MERTKISDILKTQPIGSEHNVKGWVRTKRASKNIAFIALNDGSIIHNLQIVIDVNTENEAILDNIHTGASLSVCGTVTESQGSGQVVELQASEVLLLGEADPASYPLQAKKHSLEFLREIAHLRFRTNTFGAVSRIRHALYFATHQFFDQKGFCYVHTPIITGADCEGAGEMFRVTTLPANQAPLHENGQIDYKTDFFGKETNLTVSGQLEAEMAALALGEVYTFGPTFRAENSNTSRHLAEFWMLEPEVAFADLNDNMNLAENYLKSTIQYALDQCAEDLEFLNQRFMTENNQKKKEERSDMSLLEKMHFVIDNEFSRISYTEAFDILRNSKPNKKNKFKFPLHEWGVDLQSEHEKYLVEIHFKKPVIVVDYPKTIKAFYMRLNNDNKTVSAMDILFPGIGEIIGGSQREERHDILLQRIHELNIKEKDVWWYLETRKFGTVPHSGFGLGFERLMLFVTGMHNIRDVIPFPRTPNNAEF